MKIKAIVVLIMIAVLMGCQASEVMSEETNAYRMTLVESNAGLRTTTEMVSCCGIN